jgi:sulfite reductase alpha subunit-like flavoprotein
VVATPRCTSTAKATRTSTPVSQAPAHPPVSYAVGMTSGYQTVDIPAARSGAYIRPVDLTGLGPVCAAPTATTEEAFASWSDSLLVALGGQLPAVGSAGSRPTLPWVLKVLPRATPSHCIAAVRARQTSSSGSAPFWHASERQGGTFEATVVLNSELRKDTSDGSTRLMELEFSVAGAASEFEAADTIEILPENREQVLSPPHHVLTGRRSAVYGICGAAHIVL